MLKKWIAEMKENARAAREHSMSHCGGCAHDCSLSNPGCGVGKEAAARREAKLAKQKSKEA